MRGNKCLIFAQIALCSDVDCLGVPDNQAPARASEPSFESSLQFSLRRCVCTFEKAFIVADYRPM